MQPVVRVGVGVFVWKNGKFLVMRRLGSHGAGTWSVPGGHLEFNESWENCARREVMEETGLKIKNIEFLAATNDIFENEHKHYVTIWLRSDWASGSPRVLEPDKCAELGWYKFNTLPEPLFPSWHQLKLAKPELFGERRRAQS